ncbi:MAG: carboxypeptidase M32 [Anaerolineae bacterium]|nr:carboxypeptidase M32 [Anaerolineae bacterium]
MQEKFDQLVQLLNETYNLNAAMAVLGWDQQTYMPPGGAEDRGEQFATLANILHQKVTAPVIGELLQQLTPWAANLDPDSYEVRLLKVTKRQYEREVRVPGEWVSEYARLTTNAHPVWESARKESDFSKFKPYLQKIVEMRRQYADFFKPYDHVYDPLLDEFEPGMKTADVQAIFNQLRPQQVELIHTIAQRPQIDNEFMKLSYPEQGQWDFGVDVITRFGYDWNRGRQDKAAHPFTTNFGIGDVRITTRFLENLLPSAMFSTMHEAGHALYEMGISKEFERTPLATGASLAIHESQSRMWENFVGRSLPFWKFFYPKLQAIFPSQLNGVDMVAFYKAINKVEPSLIRVEADEATYNLHVMLRLELEIGLMEGSIQVENLPQEWNQRMMDYLGITPPNDALGVLQDVHWSGGAIGYFSTYALGNLVAAQLWEVIKQDLPRLEPDMEQGKFDDLLAWLRENIHRHGAKYEPQELVEKITGSKIDPQPYVRYLREKFGTIYSF